MITRNLQTRIQKLLEHFPAIAILGPSAECDLILTRGLELLACIEIKFADAPKTTRSFTTAVQDLACRNNYFIIPNCTEPWLLREDVTVCDPAWFIREILPVMG